MITLTRPLILLDTETTGFDTDNDRIIELGFQVYEGEFPGNGPTREWRSYINPGVPIPPATTAVHHITDAMVQNCQICMREAADPIHSEDMLLTVEGERHAYKPAPTFRQLAPYLVKGLTNCDFGGKNIRYDLRITAAELARAGEVWDYIGARIVCADRLEALALPRDLGTLHEKYAGRKHDDAHGALSDARASATVIHGQLGMYPCLPRDLEAIHAASWPGWCDTEGKFRVVDNIPYVTFGKYRWKPMASVPMDYWDFLLSRKASFSPEIKAIASAAKLGRFPVAK